MRCYFCHFAEVKDFPMKGGNISYICGKCGHVHLDQIAADDFEGERFSNDERKILSITIRNEYERRNGRPFDKALTLEDLHRMSKQYRRLDPLEKMDQALLNLEKATQYFGHNIKLNFDLHYPYYHCFERRELYTIKKQGGQVFILYIVAGFLRKSLSVRESRCCKKVAILKS